jgi:hypothetical protein
MTIEWEEKARLGTRVHEEAEHYAGQFDGFVEIDGEPRAFIFKTPRPTPVMALQIDAYRVANERNGDPCEDL